MEDRFDFENLNTQIGWQNALRVLGIRRYRDFLGDTGVPTAIADDPEPASNAARQILRQLPARPNALGDLISGLLSSLVEHYGDRTSEEFLNWATRNFIDYQIETSLWAWTIALPSLAGAFSPGQRPRVESPLDPDSTDRFNQIVRSQFSRPESSKIDHRLYEAAFQYALSEEELDWLRLEQTGRDDDSEFVDLETSVSLLIHSERAFQVWRQLNSEFSTDQILIIRDWAVREAIDIGWTEEDAIRLFRS